MQSRILVWFLITLALRSHAGEPDHVSDVLQAQQGVWAGELYYLDYQSGQRFGIPMRVDAELTPDGATLIRRLKFTDPGVLVHAVSLVTAEADGGLAEAYFRDHRAELLRYRIDTLAYRDPAHWRLVYSHSGTDDDRPARIVHTLSRDGDALSSIKKVRFLDEEGGELILRNGSELTLQPDAALDAEPAPAQQQSKP